MLKKIYQELVAMRKELQVIRSSVEFIREHPFNVVTEFPPRSPKHGTDEAKKEPYEISFRKEGKIEFENGSICHREYLPNRKAEMSHSQPSVCD